MVLEILVCALGAMLILWLLWLFCAMLLLPLRTKDTYFVLTSRGSGDNLEQNCRAYRLLRSVGALERPLLLLDDGLSDEGRALADALASGDDEIHLCDMQTLQKALQAE